MANGGPTELPRIPQAGNRTVYIKTVFLKIEDINTIQETFSGMVFVRARWREPSLDHSSTRELNKINWGALWEPKLDIHNVKGDAKQEIWRDLQFGPSGEAFALEKRRCKGTFTESMELQEFPFDIQDLSILVTSDHAEGEIDLQEDQEDMSNVVTNSFVDEQEWHLKKFVQCEPRVTEDEFVQFKHRKPGLFFRCCVIRRAGFFIWNIMLVMSIISALSFVTFAVSYTLPQNRIQLSFILLLAGVTFKFAASQSVPKISYLTHLDRYILGSMIFLFLVAAWHGVITKVSDDGTAQDLDKFAFVAILILYLVLHVIFFLAMAIRGFSRRRDVHKREQEYLEEMRRKGIVDTKRFEATGNKRPTVKKRQLFLTKQRTRVGGLKV